MKRQVFFSFHFGNDVWRVGQIRNIGTIEGQELFSDRKSYTREGFIEMLKYYPLAMPKIYVSLF